MGHYDLKPVRLRTGCSDQDGRLIFLNGELTAVIVQLSDEAHQQDIGQWSMEADFSLIASKSPLFASPQDAIDWLASRDLEMTLS